MEQPFDPSQQPQQSSQPPTSDPFASVLSSLNQNSLNSQPTTPAPTAPQVQQPTQQQPQASGPPRPVPILYQLVKNLIHPQPQGVADNRPPSRSNALEDFLGNALLAMGQGLSVSRGPGAALRGFGAAATAGYDRSLQQFQLQQQAQETQARIAQQQAQTQLTQGQVAFQPIQQQAQMDQMTLQPRFDSNGMPIGLMTQKGWEAYVTQRDKGSTAAQTNALSKEQIAKINAGQISRYLPTPDGKWAAMDKQGRIDHIVNGTVDPAMMPELRQPSGCYSGPKKHASHQKTSALMN